MPLPVRSSLAQRFLFLMSAASRLVCLFSLQYAAATRVLWAHLSNPAPRTTPPPDAQVGEYRSKSRRTRSYNRASRSARSSRLPLAFR
uniref:Putative secreted protein n=1 Tax=Anopheles darlingi TaxID=43151 RepID=A0A2M4DK22_ANODA